jgi:hypothetical protein
MDDVVGVASADPQATLKPALGSVSGLQRISSRPRRAPRAGTDHEIVDGTVATVSAPTGWEPRSAVTAPHEVARAAEPARFGAKR